MLIQELIPVEYEGQRLLTGKQLADFYGVPVQRIKDNFKKTKHHFKEGRDYYLLEGGVLMQVREQINEAPRSLKNVTRSVRVYTPSGILLHGKMLNTPQALELFRKLGELPLEFILSRRTTASEKQACLYAFDMSDGTVKIGASDDVHRRKPQVEYATGLTVRRLHHTNSAPRSLIFKLERRCHETFADRRVCGEFFNITFEEACAELDRHAEEIATALAQAETMEPPPVVPVNALPPFDNERARLLVDLCNVAPDSIKEQLVRTAAEFILGRSINS